MMLLDPVIRGPMIASMLMCFAASITGVIVYLRKESLVSETISHATLPGIAIAGVIVFSEVSFIIGAFVAALLALGMLRWLKKGDVSPDAALCFTLASFFGFGLLIISRLQFSHTDVYRAATIYLFGQAATMTDAHIYIYGLLMFLTTGCITLFYKELKIITFDRNYATSLGLPVANLDLLFAIIVALSVVTGIRSVGVVLMSAMLIIPAATARQLTKYFSMMLIISAVIGSLSAFIGTNLSMIYPNLPTGPAIVLVAATFCFFSYILAPHRGWLFKRMRIAKFRNKCLQENILKALWRNADVTHVHPQAKKYLPQLKKQGWVDENYSLTQDGKIVAKRIVRLHRLWEVYLADYLGAQADRVHANAEEMEHIITPELESELIYLLRDPQTDPHSQPIPRSDELF